MVSEIISTKLRLKSAYDFFGYCVIVVCCSCLPAIHKISYSVTHASFPFFRLPTPPGKSWIFLLKIPGPGKSWKITLVLESPGKITLKVMHFSSGSYGKQAAIV